MWALSGHSPDPCVKSPLKHRLPHLQGPAFEDGGDTTGITRGAEPVLRGAGAGSSAVSSPQWAPQRRPRCSHSWERSPDRSRGRSHSSVGVNVPSECICPAHGSSDTKYAPAFGCGNPRLIERPTRQPSGCGLSLTDKGKGSSWW